MEFYLLYKKLKVLIFFLNNLLNLIQTLKLRKNNTSKKNFKF